MLIFISINVTIICFGEIAVITIVVGCGIIVAVVVILVCAFMRVPVTA